MLPLEGIPYIGPVIGYATERGKAGTREGIEWIAGRFARRSDELGRLARSFYELNDAELLEILGSRSIPLTSGAETSAVYRVFYDGQAYAVKQYKPSKDPSWQRAFALSQSEDLAGLIAPTHLIEQGGDIFAIQPWIAGQASAQDMARLTAQLQERGYRMADDMKPENFGVLADGTAVIIDPGLIFPTQP
jgi:hypothetical protein